MSYGTRLQRPLTVDPARDTAILSTLRGAIGHGLPNEDDVDWEAQFAWLHATQIFGPRGISLMRRLLVASVLIFAVACNKSRDAEPPRLSELVWTPSGSG